MTPVHTFTEGDRVRYRNGGQTATVLRIEYGWKYLVRWDTHFGVSDTYVREDQLQAVPATINDLFVPREERR